MRSLLSLLMTLFVLPATAQPIADVPLPKPRPGAGAMVTNETIAPADAPARTTRQQSTPPRRYQAACPAVLDGTVSAVRMDPVIEGICRVRSPLEVRALSVGGRAVALTPPVTLTCGMATALAGWAARIDAYTSAVLNAGLSEIRTGTSYMCRPRNNRPGGVMSEHGFANALDVTGFALDDGTAITLPADWAADDFAARSMRFAHDAACGHFTTVLGPEANASHADHLHLDLGCHGRTCTARICE